MKIRPARKSDKEEILSFCVNTFSWGDYINRVWNYWLNSGRLLIVEDNDRKIAMSHVAVCPNNKSVWLEGLRVHPTNRRSRIATKLLAKMMQYGARKGATQANAIVDLPNIALQRMMEKIGFEAVSRWAYYSIQGRIRRSKSAARLASGTELQEIWEYLQQSETYRLSAKKYVKSWHWHFLDRKALRGFIKEKRVVVSGLPVMGVAIINRNGYWDRTNILQIVYLDAASSGLLG